MRSTRDARRLLLGLLAQGRPSVDTQPEARTEGQEALHRQGLLGHQGQGREPAARDVLAGQDETMMGALTASETRQRVSTPSDPHRRLVGERW